MNNPKISIIMSTYNDEKTIKEAVNSILNQDYSEIELLVMDDSSTDRTLEILERFTDNRLKIFKNPTNIGLTKSLNILIEHSDGDYIARQDADDISLESRIRLQINFMLKNNLSVATTRAYKKDMTGIIPRFSYLFPYKYITKFKNPFIHGTLMIKKDLLLKVGCYNETFYFAQDLKLIIDLISIRAKIKIFNTPLYILNTKNNLSTKYVEEQNYYAKCARKGIIP